MNKNIELTKLKETEIGLIPDNWTLKRLFEIGEINRGKSKVRPRDAAFLYEGKYPFIQTGDIKASGGRITSYRQTYSDEGLKQSRLWPKGTICITIAATIAETGVLTFPACFPDSVIGFIPDSNKCDVNFVEYALRTVKDKLKSQAIGSVQDNINLETFKRIPVPLPSLKEQNKIAEILSSFDDKIELNRKINVNLEKIASALFKRWFVDFEFPDKDGKPYKSSGGKMIDSKLGKIPDEWRWGRIFDLIKVESGFAFSSSVFDQKGKYSLVTIKNVQDGNFIKECTDFIDNLPDKMPEYCKLKNGDILLSLTGNVGRICIVNGRDYLLNQRVAVLNPINEINRAFTYFLFRQKDFQDLLINISRGTAQQNLSPVETKNLEIVVPSDTILKLFGLAINDIFLEIVNNLRGINNLSYLRDSLLPKLMSGKIRVKIY